MTLAQIAAVLQLLIAFNTPQATIDNVERILQPKAVVVTEARLSNDYLTIATDYAIDTKSVALRSTECNGSLFDLEPYIVKRNYDGARYAYAWQFEPTLSKRIGSHCDVQLSFSALIGGKKSSQLLRVSELPAGLILQ